MQVSHSLLVQAQLERANSDGKTVFVTWIPKDLKTHPKSMITNKVNGHNWMVANQYEQTMQDNKSQHNWKIAE